MQTSKMNLKVEDWHGSRGILVGFITNITTLPVDGITTSPAHDITISVAHGITISKWYHHLTFILPFFPYIPLRSHLSRHAPLAPTLSNCCLTKGLFLSLTEEDAPEATSPTETAAHDPNLEKKVKKAEDDVEKVLLVAPPPKSYFRQQFLVDRPSAN